MPDLTDKIFEWMPKRTPLLGSTEPNKQWIVSWFALETAINTYAGPVTGHKIFDSDTDLNYPPDHTRFLNFLGDTVLRSIAYITQLITVTCLYADVPDQHSDMLKLAITAGQTDFAVLTTSIR